MWNCVLKHTFGFLNLRSENPSGFCVRLLSVYHCGWVPLRISDSDFSQNGKPGTRAIPLLSLWLGAIEAQWFWLQPEWEARDYRAIPLLSLWLGVIEAQWFRLWLELEARDREIPLLSLWLGATEDQWFWLQPEWEARDRGDSLLSLCLGASEASDSYFD
jgi:hypothetical protein